MQKYFFILGRNPELSRLEVLSFLEARNIKFKEIFFEQNFLVVEADINEININEFGGIIKLGKIDFEGNKIDFEKYLGSHEIIESDKFTYSIFGSSEFNLLREKFKKEKKKAMLKHGQKQIEFQGGEKVNLPNSDFNLFLYEFKKRIYFGMVSQSYDSFEMEKRDMAKPVRRESLAISPRLSKILINLSGAKKGDLLLDPFCGVGGIIQEAMIKEINCYGIDKDRKVIIDAKNNLEWIKKEYNLNVNFSLDSLDSKNVKNLNFDAIATETPLGILLKKKVEDVEAKKIINNFEEFIIPILRRLKIVKKEGARIAITFPVIRKFRVDSNNVAKESGLRVVNGPVLESRKDQFISRDIVVFV